MEDGASAPTPVTATPAEGEATVSWTTPSSNGGHPILGYRIAIAQSGQPFGTIDVGNVLTTKITDLPNGSSYQFSVRAVTETGPGAAGVSPSVDVDWWLPWSTPSKAGTEICTTSSPARPRRAASWPRSCPPAMASAPRRADRAAAAGAPSATTASTR
ncbi:MAG: fibronectin type III domain-containing protein [Acidimicrobiales bacterium]